MLLLWAFQIESVNDSVQWIIEKCAFCHYCRIYQFVNLSIVQVINTSRLQKEGFSKRMEHESWLIFLTEFGKIVQILADFGNRNAGGYGNFLFWQISNGCFEIIGTENRNSYPLRTLLYIDGVRYCKVNGHF